MLDTVLGVSMAPSTVRMVLVEGENGDGVTVEEDTVDIAGDDSAPPTAPEQVIAAILGTREGAAEGGYQLTSTGVTWSDQAEAAALRDALTAHKIENVMLVSAFLAAAALAQEVGSSVGYRRTGLLFVEPDTVTLAVVDSADGSVAEMRHEPLNSGDTATELAALVTDMQTLESYPDGLFMVGSGVDIAALKPRLEAATSLPVSAPEEPDMALARGAALASANAPLFASSTMALAYAQDPGTGAIDPYAVTPGYRVDAPANAAPGDRPLAYSAVAADEGDAATVAANQQSPRTGAFTAVDGQDQRQHKRRPTVLVASAVAAVFVVGVIALVVALVMTMHPTIGEQPNPGQKMAPSKQAPPGPPPPSAPAAPAPAPAAPAPAPAAPAPAPAAPAPAPAAPAPAPAAPAPAPRAPAPAPAAPPPPVMPQVPPIFGPPGQG
ncbi:DUF7159 family protein, partial [Mycobacterium sp.]|uniref:DUF7159 family protein n=1 Tax=Mycobacterium sp. TaxID=1785 RepID=UPI003D6AB5FB